MRSLRLGGCAIAAATMLLGLGTSTRAQVMIVGNDQSLNCKTDRRVAAEGDAFGTSGCAAVGQAFTHSSALEFAHCRKQLKLQLAGAGAADRLSANIEQDAGYLADRASVAASRRLVLTRSPGRFGTNEGATTMQS